MEPLLFNIPERQAPGEGAFDTHPQAVKRWVEELPMGNTSEAARRLYTAIREVNALAIAAEERFDMMETLAASLDSVLFALERSYAGSHFPLPHWALEVVEFSHHLLAQVVIAYLTVLHDQEKASWLHRLTHRNLAPACTHHAIHYLGRILFNYRQIHRPYPNGAWKTLHKLFFDADRLGVIAAKIAQPWADGEVSTVADMYKQTVLQDLLEPKLFSRPQIDEIHRHMRFFLPEAKLLPPTRWKEGMECFCIRLDVDMPHVVRFMQCIGDDKHKVPGMLLDISGLGALLDEALIAGQQEGKVSLLGSRVALERETVELLRQCWHVPLGERDERFSADKTVQAAVGMGALFALMRERSKGLHDGITDQELTSDLDPLEPSTAARKIRKGARERTPADVWDSIFYAADMQQNSWAMEWEEKAYRYIPARELNYNSSGYCFEFRNSDLEALDVGELIGFCEKEGEMPRLCAVRWLQEREDTILAGLLLLASEVEPLLVLMGEVEHCTPLRCLLGIGEDGRPQLFMPHLQGVHERPLQLVVDGREIPITLHQKVGLSPLYEAYHFSAAEDFQVASLDEEMDLAETNRLLHLIARSDEEAQAAPPRGDFSDLWDKL